MTLHHLRWLRRGALSILVCCALACGTSEDDDGAIANAGPGVSPFPPPVSFLDGGVASSAERESVQTQGGDASVPLPVSPFVDAEKDAFSTFGADVDTASYDYFRQGMLYYNTLPSPQHVRVEDFVNYFSYDYPVPATDTQPFHIALEASPHPLGRGTTLLRVGIQARRAPPQPPRDANLVFLVDVSGSMSSPDKLPLVQRLLTAALDELAPTTKLSIVTYAGDTRVALGPTALSARQPIESAIAGLSSGGSTAGASGINLAYEQAQAGFIQGGLNHVVLCTDGDFNVGITSLTDLVALIRAKRATGITLTALGFGRGNLNDAMMESVSNAGNGMYGVIYDADQAVEYANERLLSTVVHVAKDMKIQVEFNAAEVRAYRLLGYENRAIADADFRVDHVDGGEIGAEHHVTALYELVRKGETVPTGAGIPALSAGDAEQGAREVGASELVRVKVRAKAPTATDADPASETVATLAPADVAATSSPDVAWAAAVAGFAEQLRGSPYAQRAELAQIARIAKEQEARDADRRDFGVLLEKARGLMPQAP